VVEPKAAAVKPAPPAKPAKPSKSAKSAAKDADKENKPPVKAKYSVTGSEALAAGRAAAAKLAAAAGLHPIRDSVNGDREEVAYTRLTKSPFGKKELRHFREILIDKRRQLVGDVTSMETEALSGGSGSLSHLPQHMADQGSDTYDQSLALDLAASQRTLLKEIDDAIERIDTGVYGICESLGKPISAERLEHTPWARFSIEAARQLERTTYQR
jgi:RNA polymerase-binding protein DksA